MFQCIEKTYLLPMFAVFDVEYAVAQHTRYEPARLVRAVPQVVAAQDMLQGAHVRRQDAVSLTSISVPNQAEDSRENDLPKRAREGGLHARIAKSTCLGRR